MLHCNKNSRLLLAVQILGKRDIFISTLSNIVLLIRESSYYRSLIHTYFMKSFDPSFAFELNSDFKRCNVLCTPPSMVDIRQENMRNYLKVSDSTMQFPLSSESEAWSLFCELFHHHLLMTFLESLPSSHWSNENYFLPFSGSIFDISWFLNICLMSGSYLRSQFDEFFKESWKVVLITIFLSS